MESKKINQLATEMSPAISDLTIIGDPITGVSKKITLLQIADLFQTTGTVTSVAVTESGNALSITGSPITTAGTINIGFAGSANQYVRGDGALAPFPTSSGGGSSVSYYLNGSVNQGTFGGSTYYQMSKDAVIGVGTNFSTSSNGLIAQFITDANDPDVVQIPSGNWNIEFFMNVSASSGSLASFYVEIYKYNGSTFTLLATNSATPEELTNTTTVDAYYTSVAMPTSALSVTDRLAIRIYANVASKTVTLYTEDNRLCQVVTTFSKGMSSLNNLTDQSQFLATGTSGTDFAIASSGDTHTFNLPVASATNTGKLSSTDWSTFNGKVPYTGATANVDLGNFNFDANEISGGAIIAKLNGPASSPFVLKTGSSGYVIGDDAISLISSPNVANTLILASNIGVVTKTALIGLGSLTASRTFTLPDASGTLALTSNLSSYVPYTGATANVDLGTYSLTANGVTANSFNAIGSGVQGGYIYLKQGTTPYAYLLGSNGISADGTKFLLIANVDASNNKSALFELGSLANNTSRTYTLPDLSGTLALLEGSQTFSGDKEFTGGASFTNANGTYTQYGITLTKGSAPTGFFTSNVSIFADSGVTNLVIANHPTYKSKLQFQDVATLTSNYTYTFPASSGTIALTSNLSSYVPYTGATASVDLGVYALTAGDISASNLNAIGLGTQCGYLFLKQGTAFLSGALGYSSINASATKFLLTANVSGSNNKEAIFELGSLTNNTQRTFTLPDASGTIALTSDLSAYLPLTGGTLTGALSGTSATFSDIVTNTTGGIRTASSLGFILRNDVNNANLGGFTRRSYWAGGAALDTQIFAETGYGIYLNVNGGSTAGLTLASTGAATFSSSVTSATKFISSVGNNSIVFESLSATTGYQYMQLLNTTAHTIFGIEGTAAGSLLTGGLAYGSVFTSVGNTALQLGTNQTARLTITSGGNVGIGTSSPAKTLDVYNSANTNTAQIKVGDGGSTARAYLGTFSNNLYLSCGGTYASGWTTDGTNGIANIGMDAFNGGSTITFATAASNTSPTERMRITSGGGVGIGTTTVTGTTKLRVINSSASNGDALMFVDNAVYNGIGVYSAGADGYNGAATVMILGRNSSTTRSINAGGTINASGTDYAEYMTKAIKDNIAKGDIVGVDENGLLTNIFANAKSFVVKSTDPSYVGGDSWGNIDDIGKLSPEPTNEEKTKHQAKLEEARAKVDRIAFSGQVPCNVYDAQVGDYIIPIELNGKISGQAVSNPTFEQYQLSVGKVWKIMEDGRAWIAVKIG